MRIALDIACKIDETEMRRKTTYMRCGIALEDL